MHRYEDRQSRRLDLASSPPRFVDETGEAAGQKQEQETNAKAAYSNTAACSFEQVAIIREQ